jgi:uncharacterized protein YdeI (YjbR/CyaY-like superfamily)
MPTDPGIDKYIENAAEFARPMLRRFRALVHDGCPGTEEAIKWRTPAFLYNRKILFSMAAFKEHCRFMFWRPEIAALLKQDGLEADRDAAFLPRIRSMVDLPSRSKLLHYIRETRRLADESPRSPMRKRPATPKPEIAMLPELTAALAKNKTAAANFHNFSPSHRREYLEWITEAKRPETRCKRISQAVEWITSGKPRNWQYMKDQAGFAACSSTTRSRTAAPTTSRN